MTVDEFIQKIEPNADSNGCLLWMGYIAPSGYGQFYKRGSGRHGKARTGYAHRQSYELFVGLIPEGMTVDHLCRVRACVNPMHLEVVTNRENVLRGKTLPAANALKTHCPKGHLLAGDNLYVRPDSGTKAGGRGCKTCRRETMRKWHIKNRQKHHAPPTEPSLHPGDPTEF